MWRLIWNTLLGFAPSKWFWKLIKTNWIKTRTGISTRGNARTHTLGRREAGKPHSLVTKGEHSCILISCYEDHCLHVCVCVFVRLLAHLLLPLPPSPSFGSLLILWSDTCHAHNSGLGKAVKLTSVRALWRHLHISSGFLGWSAFED